MNDTTNNELRLLEQLYLSQNTVEVLTQRDLACMTGLSLGVINAMLNRFAKRGWVTLNKLSSKKVKYALTHEGTAEVLQRSVEFLRSTVHSALLYQRRVERYVHGLADQGYTNLVFAGSSEIGYLFEYASAVFGLNFVDARQKREDGCCGVSDASDASVNKKNGKTVVVIVNNDIDSDSEAMLFENNNSAQDSPERSALVEQVSLSELLMPSKDDPADGLWSKK